MPKKKTTTKKKKENKGLGIALSLAGVALGGYLLYGPNGKKNRNDIKGWAQKAKDEIAKKIDTLKDNVDTDKYHEIIDKVVLKYAKIKDVGEKEALLFGDILKKQLGGSKSVSKTKKKSPKKVTKKESSKKANKKK